jgi:hypothetical protein
MAAAQGFNHEGHEGIPLRYWVSFGVVGFVLEERND